MVSPELESGCERMKALFTAEVDRQKQSIKDLLLSVVGVEAFYYGYGRLELPDVTARQEEAFALAFPNLSLSDALGNEGLVNAWKGKVFELEVRDRLNAGESVGDIALAPGQTAVLADTPNQQAWDILILNADGSVAAELQAKATDSLAYAKSALENGPLLVTTNDLSESAALHENWHVVEGTSEQDIEDALSSAIEGGVFDEVIGAVFPLAALALSSDKEATAVAMAAGATASMFLTPIGGAAIAFGVRAFYRGYRKQEATSLVLDAAIERLKPLADSQPRLTAC